MFTNIAEKIVGNMEKQHLIQTDRRSIYKYGINQMLNMLLNTLTFLLVGLLFHKITETVIFTSAYIPLRIYAGGFHAKTPLRCWCISAIMIIAVMIIINYADNYVFVYDIFSLIAAGLILALSPIEDKNKPLDKVEKKIYKKRCIIVLVIEFLLLIVFRFFQNDNFSICIEMTWITLSLMLLIGIAKNHIIEKKYGGY